MLALYQKVLQDIKNSFEYAHWYIKIYQISSDTLKNSIIVTTLVRTLWICFSALNILKSAYDVILAISLWRGAAAVTKVVTSSFDFFTWSSCSHSVTCRHVHIIQLLENVLQTPFLFSVKILFSILLLGTLMSTNVNSSLLLRHLKFLRFSPQFIGKL